MATDTANDKSGHLPVDRWADQKTQSQTTLVHAPEVLYAHKEVLVPEGGQENRVFGQQLRDMFFPNDFFDSVAEPEQPRDHHRDRHTQAVEKLSLPGQTPARGRDPLVGGAFRYVFAGFWF